MLISTMILRKMQRKNIWKSSHEQPTSVKHFGIPAIFMDRSPMKNSLANGSNSPGEEKKFSSQQNSGLASILSPSKESLEEIGNMLENALKAA